MMIDDKEARDILTMLGDEDDTYRRVPCSDCDAPVLIKENVTAVCRPCMKIRALQAEIRELHRRINDLLHLAAKARPPSGPAWDKIRRGTEPWYKSDANW
jgi:hypothetical protein